jgi:hypothetical protein
LKIENLALGPVVEIDVRVLQVAGELLQLDVEFHIVWVSQDEFSGLHFCVGLKVEVFISLHRLVEVLV